MYETIASHVGILANFPVVEKHKNVNIIGTIGETLNKHVEELKHDQNNFSVYVRSLKLLYQVIRSKETWATSEAAQMLVENMETVFLVIMGIEDDF